MRTRMESHRLTAMTKVRRLLLRIYRGFLLSLCYCYNTSSLNGYDSANLLFGGADGYFSTSSMRNLGPNGDYSNIAAYHLLGSANGDGKDYIRQIGDFNSSFDTFYKDGGQVGLGLNASDKDGNAVPLVSDNQPSSRWPRSSRCTATPSMANS